MAQTLPAVPAGDTLPRADSLAYDTVVISPPADTARRFLLPPGRWRAADQYRTEDLLAGPFWPMPPVDQIAGGDLADWLSFHPAYDVDDASGVGQTRYFSHWGLAARTGDWRVDGRTAAWQRLAFPMTAEFDPGTLPDFVYADAQAGAGMILRRDTAWGDRPVFDYTFRQGDYSDTHSEGFFRAHTRGGFGLDLSGRFVSSQGRYALDDRDLRNLRLETFGPVGGGYFWRARYDQFRDKTYLIPPEPFDQYRPRRDDLLWTGEAAIGRFVDSLPLWQTGARLQSGAQRFATSGYEQDTRDRDWQLFAESRLFGWNVTAQGGWQEFERDSSEESRWYLIAGATRRWEWHPDWTAAFSVTASDWETDPLSLSAVAALAPTRRSTWRPTLRLARVRTVPTLLDRGYPELSHSLADNTGAGFIYTEAGEPSLEDQWENALTLQWGADRIDDSAGLLLTLGGQAAYVENYTHWEGRREVDTILGNPVTSLVYRPRADDVRSLGAAVGVHGRAFWKIHYLVHYAVKYAVTLDDEKLSGYYPHKGGAMVSLIAPRWKYDVDVRLNAAGLWWYGDGRIDPSGYASNHVFRFDLSGSARVVGDLTIYALLQNVANFPYRTRAGMPFTGRTVRFGLHVTLFD